MTVPDTHLGEPLRPLLRRTFARALLGGVWAYVVVIALLGIASLSSGTGVVAERLLLTPSAFTGVTGSLAQAILGAALFTVPIVIVLERGDRRRVSPELTFVAVLAGTLVAAFTVPTEEGSWGFAGVAVTVLAIHWLVYGANGPRRAWLPRRTVLIAGTVLLVTAAGVAVWRATAEPLVASDPPSPLAGWSRQSGDAVDPAAAEGVSAAQIDLALDHAGPGPVTIVDIRSLTPGVRVTPLFSPDSTAAGEWSYQRFRPLAVGPDDHVFVPLATDARCDAIQRATLELVYAGGRTQRLPLSGADSGTCEAP